MIEWSSIAWHVTTHYVAFFRRATLESQRACTCCTLLGRLRRDSHPLALQYRCAPGPHCQSHSYQDVSSMHRTIWKGSLQSLAAWKCDRLADLVITMLRSSQGHP